MSLLPALALFGTIGTPELLIILFILLLIFGASKLPQLGGAVGKTIRNFKSEMKDGQAEEPKRAKTKASSAAGEARFCPSCGAPVFDEGAKFCAKCGKSF
ncbi:MAG: twin-arginine translocase TatA/TatE family subunit [Acidobacteriota bacterium]